MKIAVFFFLATAFAVGVSTPVNMTDGAEEDFKFMNETGVDEPEQFNNDTVLDQEKEDNETVNSGDFFVTANFSGTEQPETKRSLTSGDDPIIEPESGSGPLDTGSADIEEASSGITEAPTGDFVNNEEKEEDDPKKEDEEEGGTDSSK